MALSNAHSLVSPFVSRHIGPREHEIEAMLHELGYRSLDELTSAVIPSNIADNTRMHLQAGVTEEQALEELRSIANKNRVLKSFIGLGYYGTFTPKVIQRNVLENPAWYTAYTPYQPEISQGRLEILFYFQTMICELTGMDISGASLLDEGTAAAEAMALCHRSSKQSTATCFLVSTGCHPQTIDLIRTRAVFFADVFVRRVAIDLGLPLRILADRLKLRRNKTEALDNERKSRLDRLRNTKTTASGDLEKQRSASQMDLDANTPSSSVPSTSAADAFGMSANEKKQNQDSSANKPGMGVEEEQSYTSRLLDAKRKAKKNQ